MSAESKKKLHQYALWFDYHRRSISDPAQAHRFTIKALDQIADVLAYLWRDIHDLERRNSSPTALTDAGIWLPTHLRREMAEREMRENPNSELNA